MNESSPTSRSFISQRLKLHYLDWGNADAPPMLLIHGGRDHCRSWDWTAQRLRARWHIIAPDLRGHGDSAWSPEGNYVSSAFVYDLAQLIHQLDRGPVTLISHSLGGGIALRFAGLYPDKVAKVVAIEGLGLPLELQLKRAATPFAELLREWIERKRQASARQPRRYATIEDALERMKAENSFLSDEQARHLTLHGANRNEDGTWTWKFDNYLYSGQFNDMPLEDIYALWGAIRCPTLLMHGTDSWVSNPAVDGSLAHFRNAQVVEFEKAGHWLHHDQFERFMREIEAFL